MKRFSSLTATLVTLVSLILFLSPGVASAQTFQARSRTVTTHSAETILHTSPSGARRANYDPNDPSDSGCWSKNAVWANWGTLTVDGYSVQAINWYSYGCNTNWVEISWSGGTAVQTYVAIWTYTSGGGLDTQCYPTLSGCPVSNVNTYYTGGLSPSWTDMVNGTNTTYVYLKLRASATGDTNQSPTNWIPA